MAVKGTLMSNSHIVQLKPRLGNISVVNVKEQVNIGHGDYFKGGDSSSFILFLACCCGFGIWCYGESPRNGEEI
jgi:hypothetical protein